jgi:4-aminobutyrate aminotransferase
MKKNTSPPSLDDSNRSAERKSWQARALDDATRSLLEEDSRFFIAQSLSTPCLNGVRAAQGIYIEDTAGRRYMDFHGNSVHHVGHAHKRVVAAVKAQLDDLTFAPRRYANFPAVALARALVEVAPPGLTKCLFAPSGNDAMEIALRLARGATGRYKTIGFWGAFHGAGVAASSIGGEAIFRGLSTGPLLPGSNHVAPPSCYRCPYGHESSSGCCMMAARAIREIIEQERDIAAVVAAPVSVAEFVPPPGFWRAVRAACDEWGMLLVFDEVQTGLGKTGRMFACEHDGAVPDILVLGKALGGGMVPLAAVIARADLDVLGDIAIGHFTHEKNPVLAAAGLATLSVIRDEGLVERARSLGELALKRGRELAARYQIVGDVRGRGLQIAIDLVSDRATKKRALEPAEKIVYLALDRGLSLKLSAGSVLVLNPPLTIGENELERAFAIIEECLAEVTAGHQQPHRLNAHLNRG